MAELTRQTITVYRGEPVRIPFAFEPAEDITGQTIVFTVSKTADSSAAKLIGPIDVEITDEATGEFDVVLTEEHTNLKAATYEFDVWRVDEGFEAIKAAGQFVVVGNARVPPLENV